MIQVTETKYLEGTGEIDTLVEYPKANNYTVDPNGNLTVYSINKTDLDLTPGAINFLGSDNSKIYAYYPAGTYRRVLVIDK